MRRYRFIISLIALALLIGSLSGCDNRTGFEKGVDKTADKIKDIAR
jgi:predicted small secreted protein